MRISIVPYSKDFEERHIEFASKYWTKRRRKVPNYIYWKFRGAPQDKLISFILAIHNNKVIGQLGLIPCNINIGGEIYNAQWACDLMVDKDFRGKNIASLLYDYAHKLTPITLGSNPSPAATKSMKKKGYKSLRGSWKHLFAVKIGEISKLKKINSSLLDSIYNPFYPLYLLINKFSKYSFELIDKMDYEILVTSQNKNKIYVCRDQEFIKWRFSPFKEFYPGIEIMKAKKNSTFYSGYFSGSTYLITDFNIKNIFSLLQIISDIIRRFKSKGLLRVRFNNNSNLSKWLLFFGIIKFRTQTVIIYYTDNEILNQKMMAKSFYYTYMDSDENI